MNIQQALDWGSFKITSLKEKKYYGSHGKYDSITWNHLEKHVVSTTQIWAHIVLEYQLI